MPPIFAEYVNYLRAWLAFVAFMSVGNTIQCFIDISVLRDVLYADSKAEVTPLAARLFAVWTLLAGGLRLFCALRIYNKSIYHLTLFSFLLVLGHFGLEYFYFKTVALSKGLAAPLTVSGVSSLLMIIGYWFVWPSTDTTDDILDNPQLLRKTKKRK